MNVLTNICIGLSAGIVFGFAAGGLKAIFRRRPYAAEQVEAMRRLVGKAAALLKYATFMLLVLGLVWCIYFLVLGIVRPEQADYANNMAELVAAVLTVISILFAFVEFLRQKGDRNRD